MTLGFDKSLYILPFDHRGSFEAKMFGWEGALADEQTGQITAAKQVIIGTTVLGKASLIPLVGESHDKTA